MKTHKKLKTTILTIMLISFAALSKPSLADTLNNDTRATLAFMSDFNFIFVQMSIENSQQKYLFLVDTGFDVNVIEESLAKKLSLKLSQPTTQAQPGGDITYTKVENTLLNITGEISTSENFIAINMSHFEGIVGHKISGILGVEFLKKFIVTVNYDNDTIGFDQLHSVQKFNEFVKLPFVLQNNEPFVYAELKNANGNMISGKFKLDTGSADAIGFNKNFLENNTIINDLTSFSKSQGFAVGGETQGIDFMLTYFSMGQSKIENFQVSATLDSDGFENRSNAGTIGCEIMRRYNWIFDLANQNVYLQQNSHFDEATYFDASGLMVIKDEKNKFVAYQVKHNSIAEKAGIKASDVITHLNGEAIENYSLFEIKKILSKIKIQEVSLKLSNKNKLILLN